MTTFRRVFGVFAATIGMGGIAAGWLTIMTASAGPPYVGFSGLVMLVGGAFVVHQSVSMIEDVAPEA